MAEVVHEARDLELDVVGKPSGEPVGTLQGMGEDVDRVAVGPEGVERAVARGDEGHQLVDGRHRSHLHAGHGTRRICTVTP